MIREDRVAIAALVARNERELKRVRGELRSEAEARDALRGEILNTIVDLADISFDKYGRVLARVTRQRGCLGGRREDMSTWLLDRGYAVPYDGGAKPARVDWAKLRRQAQEQRI